MQQPLVCARRLMDEGYEEQHLWVDPSPEYSNDWAVFTGKKVSDISRRVSQSGKEMRDEFFTLYETPHEGYKLYVEVSATDAPNDVRQLGHRAAGGSTTRVLFSEKDGKQKYPEVFDKLLEIDEEDPKAESFREQAF